MKASKKGIKRIATTLLLSILLGTGVLVIMASPVAHAYSVTKDKTATHEHTWIWNNVEIGDTYLSIHWTYRQYYVGYHIVDSEIVGYDSPVYVVEKERSVDSTISYKDVKPINAQHEYAAWGETEWYINVGVGHKKAVTYTAIHFTDYGGSWSEDKWIEYP